MRTKPIVMRIGQMTNYDFGDIEVEATPFFVSLTLKNTVSNRSRVTWHITYTEAAAIGKVMISHALPDAIPNALEMLEANGIHGGDVYNDLKALMPDDQSTEK